MIIELVGCDWDWDWEVVEEVTRGRRVLRPWITPNRFTDIIFWK